MNFLHYLICFRERKRQDYQRKLDKAASMIEKEMDLGRFIQRQRLHTIAILGLLGGRQAHLATKMSQLTIHGGIIPNSASSDEASSGDNTTRKVDAKRLVK